MMHYSYLESPIGPLLIAGDREGLCEIRFPKNASPPKPEPDWIESSKYLDQALSQLSAYFEGTLRDFTLSLAPKGTAFQRRVWEALQDIPYGRTISYGELARIVGRPKAARAVGAANGKNPLPIVIPCHRVIGASGKLTGYAGGLDVKKALLELEAA